jgi:hypothetical protein
MKLYNTFYIYYYYTLHNILLYKSNKTIRMFNGKFYNEGNNLVDNPNIYNVERDNRLSFTQYWYVAEIWRNHIIGHM